MSNFFTRIIKTELFNFKNVNYGQIKYLNYSSVNSRAKIENNDVLGIYGQNGSGKTAIIEAMDILKNLLSGHKVPFDYSGIIRTDGSTKIITHFYIEYKNSKYKAIYEVSLKSNFDKKIIEICNEKLSYYTRGATWKSLRSFAFSNPYYDNSLILNEEKVDISVSHKQHFEDFPLCKHINSLALFCSQKNASVFFNNTLIDSFVSYEPNNQECSNFTAVLTSLFYFGNCYLSVIKVNQLSDINNDYVVPINIFRESDDTIVQACLPLLIGNSNRELPESIYNELKKVIPAINIALKSIVPNLKIEINEIKKEVKPDNKKYVTFDVYSIRENKKFLIKYESEGIKRIVSLLHYLISLYNKREICLIVDELDSGIFEYLLGELLGVFSEEAKGQLIFTSHNLRAFEKMNSKHFICSTTNPNNRYINLVGIEKNHNQRDFYLRTVLLGGQKEELYDALNLQTISYAFKEAYAGNTKDVKLDFSTNFKNIIENNANKDVE